MEKYVIERLAEVKAVVIRYDLWISRKTEGKFSLTAHECTGQERNGVSMSLSVMEVVENFGLEENIVGITSDGGGNIWVCREALESKYTKDSVFFHPSPC